MGVVWSWVCLCLVVGARRTRRSKSGESVSSLRQSQAEHHSFFPKWSQSWDVQEEADAHALVGHYGRLIRRHAEELRSEMRLADEYSRRKACKGTLGDVEAAMLYLLVRMTRPRRVLEVGALCGYSTRWLLAGLERNARGELQTFDLSDVVTSVLAENLDRWRFKKADIATVHVQDLANFDLIFIDALHMNAFARMYTRRVLDPVNRTTPVVVHDIFNPLMIPPYASCRYEASFHEQMACINTVAANWTQLHPSNDLLYGPAQATGEGQELLSWLARTARTASPLLTFSPYAAPVFALGVRQAFIAHNIISPDRPLNQPAAFFLLRGKKRQQETPSSSSAPLDRR